MMTEWNIGMFVNIEDESDEMFMSSFGMKNVELNELFLPGAL